ncbi:S-adenosyl-L-methionine-dependent methyltransferase [Leptodontidium sp. MPI-SDFR-AT-0119]|nr:S-adenosyl-L-methionine-dependent methyltransferase [Leptodontidium sp. MPI-SDFR-AT-0119]
MAGRPHTSDTLPEYKEELSRKQVDLIAGGSWTDDSTMAGSEVGPKREHGRSGVVGSVASNLALSEFGSPVLHVNNPSHADDHDHTEIALLDAYDDSDLDSAIELDRRDLTTSLSLEVLKPVERYGRGYHGYHEGKYLMPNDEPERDRLDLQHRLFCLTLGESLHLARLPTIHRALDIGTGTGIWSIDFAEKHPDVQVYGVDLSLMQLEWSPPNCTFEIDDLSLSWTFEFLFDFIYGRMLFCSFSDLLHVFREAFKALTAGGVIEM